LSTTATHGPAPASLLCLLALAWCGIGSAAEVFVHEEPQKSTPVNEFAAWYLEGDEPLTPEAALQMYEAGEFTSHEDQGDIELGMMKGVAWVGLTIRNESNEDELVLKFENPRLSFADLYVPSADGFNVLLNGSARPYDHRAIRYIIPSFPLEIPQGGQQTVLLRCQNLGDMRIPLAVCGKSYFYQRMGDKFTFERLLSGALILLAIYQLIVFLSLREVGYAYLSLFTFSWLLFYLAGAGVGPTIFWDSGGWYPLRANTLSSILMCASFVLFTVEILEAKKRSPMLYLGAKIFIAFCAVYFLYCCFTHSAWRIVINQVLVVCALAGPGMLLAQGLYKGYRRAYIFLITWTSMVLGGAYMVLVSFELAPATLLTATPVPPLLITASILSWTFDLTGRVKLREQLQQEILETQVRQRTHELEQALAEVKTLSGLLPICSSCKRVRDDSGYWNTVEHYITQNTDANFTHGICPDCKKDLYPEYTREQEEEEEEEEPGEPWRKQA